MFDFSHCGEGLDGSEAAGGRLGVVLTGAGTQPGKGQGCPLQAPPHAAPADEDYYLLALQHLEMV